MPERKAISKPVDVRCWPIDDVKDMADIMDFLADKEYYGTITNVPNAAGIPEYRMIMSKKTSVDHIIFKFDDVLICNGDDVTVMPKGLFHATYDVT